MKINTVPVEAYRQAGNTTVRRPHTEQGEPTAAGKSNRPDTITLPGANSAEAQSLKLNLSPSALSSVLSSEEKNMLVKHFARFGDGGQEAPTYGTDAKPSESQLTGLAVDLRG